MSALSTSGYDAAQARREDDALDRWRVASEVVEVALATPAEWSARIGIFGKWGEGKSTVLRFAEAMLRERKSIVFWFNPWAIQNWNDLWEEFGSRLSESLSAAGIPVDSTWLKATKDSTKWLESKGAGQIAKAGAAALGKEKAVEAAFSLVGRWLKYDGPQIRAIQKKVKQRRLVVLIDDLDRCAPELLPQLLLSLRELLDLPGFTFLLAFDDEIVARALTDANPAWSEGSNFLEKILDFRFHLPPITELQKVRFISKAVTKYCPFVSSDSIEKIRDLLPNNPRRLKALVRSLAALGPQVARHDPDELNWVDMWLAQMLRLESYPFFERLLKGETLDEEAGTLYRLLKSESRTRLGGEGADKNQGLRKLISESGVKDAVIVDRLIRLIEAVRSRSSVKFRYICEMSLRPHAITWREFRSFYAAWINDARPETLSSWIELHASERGVSAADVQEELFETIIVKRDGCLSAAAESASIEEHDALIHEAGMLLELAEQYLLDPTRFAASRFRKLLGQASFWIGFRRNQTDKILRDKEEASLMRLLSSVSGPLSVEVFESLVPQSSYMDIAEGAHERKGLHQRLLASVSAKAASEAIAFLTREGSVQSLTEQGRFNGVKRCLFQPDSDVWKTSLRDDLLMLIRKGQEDFVIYKNLRDLFHMVVRGLQYGIDTIPREDVAAILIDEEFVRTLWETIISRGIQYRVIIAYIRARDSLIQSGIPEQVLPLTAEMESRLKEERSQPVPQANESSEAMN
jgi:hypothetical protein